MLIFRHRKTPPYFTNSVSFTATFLVAIWLSTLQILLYLNLVGICCNQNLPCGYFAQLKIIVFVTVSITVTTSSYHNNLFIFDNYLFYRKILTGTRLFGNILRLTSCKYLLRNNVSLESCNKLFAYAKPQYFTGTLFK